MELNVNMSVELTPDDIKKAILAYLNTDSRLSVATITPANITFQVKSAYHSSDPRERDEVASLTGAKVSVKAEPTAYRGTSYMDR